MHKNFSLFEDFIIKLKRKISYSTKEIVFVCIGSNKIIGDSIGPRIGSLLKQNTKLQIYGDMNNNISKYEEIKNISNKLKNKFVIAIDSALSDYDDIGEIYVTNKRLKLAEGMNLNKGTIGDLCIKVVVGRNMDNRYKNFMKLKNADINFIEELSINIAVCIKLAVQPNI